MKSLLVPKKIIGYVVLAICLLLLWIFQVQQRVAIAADLEMKEQEYHKTALETTVLEAQYIKIFSEQSAAFLEHSSLIQEKSPQFVRRARSFSVALDTRILAE